ncbi:MAG: hypothetical protein HY769_05990 [Candidatus Stahlbacteria bacterium]|nr:hypothetical protein [Candidatus Stahlbacteria bacterium]
MQDKRSKIPSIDSLLRHLKNYPHNLAKETLVEVTGKWRKKKVGQGFSLANIEDKIIQETIDILERNKQTLKKVINATGVILNTNLGRAPLPKEAINGLKDISCGYTNLEIDIDSGERGDRSNLISALLHKLTGAEDSLVVNNNAAAVFLILDTFAKNREVICSRGELIEIGGDNY